MSLHEIRYRSDALQKHTGCFAVHPDPSVPRPYHCMLLLHGLSDDYSIWQRRTSIERYLEGKPIIAVMPDGGRGFYVDALRGFKYLQAVAYELPQLLNDWFKIDGKWCTAGLSMGGYGALRVALERPDMFVSAVSHSGAVIMGHSYPVEDKAEPRGIEFLEEFLPVFGSCVPGGANDLLRLAAEANPLPALRFDCGTEDFLLESNRFYHKLLTEASVPHEYEEFPGDHNWAYWDEHIQEAIAFHLKHLAL